MSGVEGMEDTLLEKSGLFGSEQVAVVNMHQDIVGFLESVERQKDRKPKRIPFQERCPIRNG